MNFFIKKIFIVVFCLTSLLTTVFSKINHRNMMLIDLSLRDDDGAYYIHRIKVAGEAAKWVLKQLKEVDASKDKEELVRRYKFFMDLDICGFGARENENSLNAKNLGSRKEDFSEVNKENINSDRKKGSTEEIKKDDDSFRRKIIPEFRYQKDEDLSKLSIEEIKQRLVELYKHYMLDSRVDFLQKLRGGAFLVKGIVIEALKNKKINPDQSYMVSFFSAKHSEARDYFYKTINNSEDLKKACFEFVVFCSEFLHSISSETLNGYRSWCSAGKDKQVEKEQPYKSVLPQDISYS